MRFVEVEPQLLELESCVQRFEDEWRRRVGIKTPIYNHDFLVWELARRTRAITRAFCDLIRGDNEIVASMLIRLNLENVLLLEAGERHPGGPDGFFMDFLGSSELRRIKDSDNQSMTWTYLAERFDDKGEFYLNNEHEPVRVPREENAKGSLKDVWKFYEVTSIGV